MYCKKCGSRLEMGWRYCPKCSLLITENTIEYDEMKILEKQKKEKQKAAIYISIFLLGLIGMSVFDKIAGICFLASLVSIVTGFIECQNSIVIKVLFWIFLICIIVFFVIIFVAAYTCLSELSRWDCSGMW